jgi:hypothetical protein
MLLALDRNERIFPMKPTSIYAAFFLFILLFSVRAADAPSSTTPAEKQLLALVKEVQTQQQAIADNEAKIEAKLATIAETLRMARIFSTRGK